MKTQKAAKLAVALFFAALTAIGLVTCGDYGVLPVQNHQAAHVMFDWLTAQLQWEPLQLAAIWQMYLWLWFMAGLWALYAICRNTELGRSVSCLGVLAVYLSPRFFAQAHFDGGILLMSVTLCLLWLLLRFAKRPGIIRGICAACFLSLLVWMMVAQKDGNAVHPAPSLLEMMLTTQPLYMLPLAGIGLLTVCRRVWEQRRNAGKDPVTLLLAVAVLCLLLPLAGNGLDWRFACFVYAGLAILSARGISGMYRFGRHFGGDCGMHLVLLAGLILFFGWTARDIARNHPVQYAYFNRIGHTTAMQSAVRDPDHLSAAAALDALLEADRNPKRKLTVAAWENEGYAGLERAHALLSAEAKKQLRISKKQNVPYLLSYAGHAGEKPKGYHELLQVESYGITLCTVYEKD